MIWSVIWTGVLAAAGALGLHLDPELTIKIVAIGGAVALLAGRIAALTPNKTDDSIVGWLEELLGRIAGGGTSGKGSVKPP